VEQQEKHEGGQGTATQPTSSLALSTLRWLSTLRGTQFSPVCAPLLPPRTQREAGFGLCGDWPGFVFCSVMRNCNVAIVGGGPAGLSAALTLARSRKRVVVIDRAEPRNRIAAQSHGFLTRDGAAPFEVRRAAIEQIESYGTVAFERGCVESILRHGDRFVVTYERGEALIADAVLLGLGMVDVLPDIPGFQELWGGGVLHCPYCHGYEVSDLPWGCYVSTPEELAHVHGLPAWTDDLIVFADPALRVSANAERRLEGEGIRLERRAIRKLIPGPSGALQAIEVEGGTRIPRRVLLWKPPQRQTPLVLRLGLELDDAGFVKTDSACQTSTPGIFAAGDLSCPHQQLIIAAGEGAKAAFAIDRVLAARRARARRKAG